ncbi:MAG: hypothetical protein AAGI45_05360 [Cyanobacteria bacterium P01_H01_bin.26]
MPLSPVPKPTVNFFTSSVLIFGGSFSGIHLTDLVAPYSQWSDPVGFLMFPIAFLTGMQLWPRVGRLIQSSSRLQPTKHPKKMTPVSGGAFIFLLTSVAASSLSGLIMTPPSMEAIVDPGYKTLIAAGILYGAICWSLSQLGYLQCDDTYPKD